jgi:hypothetical protein
VPEEQQALLLLAQDMLPFLRSGCSTALLLALAPTLLLLLLLLLLH